VVLFTVGGNIVITALAVKAWFDFENASNTSWRFLVFRKTAMNQS
tara:strand:+ start:1922 stop:2056 length:135 start_codon:yes stop_codon:yes gene_type:complete